MAKTGATIALLLLSGMVTTAFGSDFTIRLGLKNAHLREVFFGCAAGATAGYDRHIDDFAPPPGIQTGYVGFISNEKNLPLFYKDIHGTEPRQTWRFYARVYKGKPIEITWDAASLPKGWTFSLTSKSGTIDMSKITKIVVPTTQILVITGKNAAAGPQKAEAPAKTKDK